MKELEIALRVRNNRLKERRDKLGLNQAELCRKIGADPSKYGALESLKTSPFCKDGVSWRKIIRQLADFYFVEPEELFPSTVLAVTCPMAVRKVDVDDLYPLLSSHQEKLLSGPSGEYERKEVAIKLDGVLAKLKPRDARVLRLRYGFEDGEEKTLKQAGKVFGVSRERFRQMEAHALRRAKMEWLEESVSGDMINE